MTNDRKDRKVGLVHTCIDGRLHVKEAELAEQLCDLLAVDIVYILTEAGPDGILCEEGELCRANLMSLNRAKELLKPDVEAEVSHYDCAGHTVTDAQHDQDTLKAADILSKEFYGALGKVAAVIAYPTPDGDGPTWSIKSLNSVTS